MGHYTQEIFLNTERINQLKNRIDETVMFRDKSQINRLENS